MNSMFRANRNKQAKQNANMKHHTERNNSYWCNHNPTMLVHESMIPEASALPKFLRRIRM